jgi:rSAM/selenodomain-associated transferase 1
MARFQIDGRKTTDTGREALAVMAKAPSVGSVKTRLFGALGPERATALYACFLRDTFEIVEAACAKRGSIVPVLCYAGDEGGFDGVGLRVETRLAQRGEGLGGRLTNCFADLFAAGYGAVAVMGADSPTLPTDVLVEAFEAIESERRLALGPTEDGGYYLMGARRLEPSLFQGIAWSTERVLRDTMRAATEAGFEIRLLPEWYDVDTPDELERLAGDLRRASAAAPFTRRFLGI